MSYISKITGKERTFFSILLIGQESVLQVQN